MRFVRECRNIGVEADDGSNPGADLHLGNGDVILCCILTAATKKDACDHQDYLVDVCGVGYLSNDISKTFFNVFKVLFVGGDCNYICAYDLEI